MWVSRTVAELAVPQEPTLPAPPDPDLPASVNAGAAGDGSGSEVTDIRVARPRWSSHFLALAWLSSCSCGQLRERASKRKILCQGLKQKDFFFILQAKPPYLMFVQFLFNI